MNELRRLILTLPDDLVLALNAWAEARGEWWRLGDVAYAAVGAVVLNRVWHPRLFENSVQRVVAAFRQFSWTNWDEAIKDPQYHRCLELARHPEDEAGAAWRAARRVAQEMLAGKIENPVANSTYYFNPKVCRPTWAARLKLVAEIGNHRFLAQRGDPGILWPGGGQ